jgi:hypothetical protein
MSEFAPSTFHGRCHCGAVQFDVEMALEGLMTCNCSLCGRTGAIMTFVPAGRIHNLVGEDQLTDYQFGARRIHHAFCRTCGVRPFGKGPGHDGQDWAMINVRCLEGVDVHKLTVARQYDGAAL